jgi:hypothetical protein
MSHIVPRFYDDTKDKDCKFVFTLYHWDSLSPEQFKFMIPNNILYYANSYKQTSNNFIKDLLEESKEKGRLLFYSKIEDNKSKGSLMFASPTMT